MQTPPPFCLHHSFTVSIFPPKPQPTLHFLSLEPNSRRKSHEFGHGCSFAACLLRNRSISSKLSIAAPSQQPPPSPSPLRTRLCCLCRAKTGAAKNCKWREFEQNRQRSLHGNFSRILNQSNRVS